MRRSKNGRPFRNACRVARVRICRPAANESDQWRARRERPRRRARLQANQTARQSTEERQNLRTPKLLAQNRRSLCIDPVPMDGSHSLLIRSQQFGTLY